jgi:hypothetical protein
LSLVKKLDEKPRRRVVALLKLEADDWRTLQHDLEHLSREISRHGRLPATSISGGYSSGHIIVSSEDASIDHDAWAIELNRYLDELAEQQEKAKQEAAQS